LICCFDIHEENIAPEKPLDKKMMFQMSLWILNHDFLVITLALLLIQANDKSIETYRRVGIAEVPIVDGLATKGREMKNVCII
jgi:hypothetical protein